MNSGAANRALKVVIFFTTYMANDEFSESPRRADSKNLIFIFPYIWVWVTSGAHGLVLVGFGGGGGGCQLSPFWGRGRGPLVYIFLLPEFLLAYMRNTPCFHGRKMALPDTNDPHFFYDDIAAARKEDEVVV